MSDFSLKGSEQVIAKLHKMAEAYPKAAAAQIYQEALAIDADMVPRIPVEYGRLRSSHYVAPPTEQGGRVVCEVGVGTEYGIYVHERTELNHVVGEAKFLEKAIKKRMAGMLARMARGIQSKAEAGIGVSAVPAGAPTRPAD